jgi:hypothetical protein
VRDADEKAAQIRAGPWLSTGARRRDASRMYGYGGHSDYEAIYEHEIGRRLYRGEDYDEIIENLRGRPALKRTKEKVENHFDEIVSEVSDRCREGRARFLASWE